MMKVYLSTIFILSILLLVERIHAIKSSSFCWIASPSSSISTITKQDALRSKRKGKGMMPLSRRNRTGRPGGGPLFVLPPPSPEMIDSLSQNSYTVPEVTSEQLWVGFIAGVLPFIYAAYEFWKRIDTQQRCAVCQGTGLVSISKTGKALKVPRKCFNCGGLVPWAGWKAFWTGTFDVGNGGVLQRPAADYDRVSEEVRRRREAGLSPSPMAVREEDEDD